MSCTYCLRGPIVAQATWLDGRNGCGLVGPMLCHWGALMLASATQRGFGVRQIPQTCKRHIQCTLTGALAHLLNG